MIVFLYTFYIDVAPVTGKNMQFFNYDVLRLNVTDMVLVHNSTKD